MMVLVPALGVPSEELLQDTLKSILVSLFSMSAAFIYFWPLRNRSASLHASWVLLLPLGLVLYGLYSMTWSHAYLAGVEAVRWFIFSLILFLGINTFTAERSLRMAWGIHIGATIACVWAVLQFWFDFGLFPQGPAPASTFVNRNFFAEYVVCALPFSAWLSISAKTKRLVFLIALSMAFNITALLMTGTRSATVTLLILIPLLALAAWLARQEIASRNWSSGPLVCLAMIFLVVIFGMGSIPSSNASIAADWGHSITALERGHARTVSITDASEYKQGSMSIRIEMWLSTLHMIQTNPILGVGAGAWEVQIPRYQDARRELETDYYAHNEFLQLVSEYGAIGWVFLAGLAMYLFRASRRTLQLARHSKSTEVALRTCVLTSLLALMLVSCFGFPWRLAPSGSLFAVGLGLLAASDLRLGTTLKKEATAYHWNSGYNRFALIGTSLATLAAIAISWQAIVCESRLTRALKIALTISQSRDPQSPRWEAAKAKMIQLTREGVAINPHYRKLTPSIADALANWGDWTNANWLWRSVLDSRPFVVVLLTNLARGHLHVDDLINAQDYFQRAKLLQPDAISVRNLDLLILSRSGHLNEACSGAMQLIRSNRFDYETLRLAYFLGRENRDAPLSILAQEVRIKGWPEEAVDAWLKLGNIHAGAGNESDAIQSYRAALKTATNAQRTSVLAAVPEHFRAMVE